MVKSVMSEAAKIHEGGDEKQKINKINSGLRGVHLSWCYKGWGGWEGGWKVRRGWEDGRQRGGGKGGGKNSPCMAR